MFPTKFKLQDIANLFCIIQVILYIMALVTGNNTYILAIILCSPINVCFASFLNRHCINIIELLIILSTFLLFLFFALTSPREYISKYPLLLMGLNTFFISLIFKGRSALNLIYLLNWAVNISVLLLGMHSNFHPSFGNQIFENLSRNIVSAQLIFAMVYYLFFNYRYNSNKINLILVALFLFNSIVLYGRTGVALALALFLYSLYRRLNRALLLSILSLSAIFISLIFSIIMESTNFSTGLDTPRIELLKEYFYFITSLEIFFGRSIEDCCSFILYFHGNPHNSFVAGHMKFGIFHTIFYALVILIILATKKTDLIFFILILYVRYSIDTIGLFSMIDIVLFSIFIYAYNSLKKNKKQTNTTKSYLLSYNSLTHND